MVNYVTVGKDGTVSLICPRCNKIITSASPPRNLDCGHTACTECAHVKHRDGLVKPHARCHSCTHVTRRPQPWLPPVNIALLNIAVALNKRTEIARQGKIQCGECNGYYEEKEMRLCLEEKCGKFRQCLCLSCLMQHHNKHPALKYGEDVHKSMHGNHKRMDHFSLSDRREIDARGEKFVVSATYLSAHSPFFSNLFYGSPEASATLEFTLDLDPTILSDLLDMIYPCATRDLPYIVGGKSCCDNCIVALPGRLEMAIHLGFESIVDRINRSITLEQKVNVYSGLTDSFELLKKYVAPTAYSYEVERLMRGNPQMLDRIKPFLQNYRSYTNDTPPSTIYRMPPNLPDSRVVHVEDASFMVSASVLSLLAPWFLDFFYNETSKFEEEANLMLCEAETFAQFIEIINGNKEKVVSTELKSFLKTVGAKLIMEKHEIS